MLQIKDHLREEMLPHIWCPGCGNGTVAKSIIQAVQNLGYDKDKMMVVTGIGCSSRTNNIMDYNTFQSTHGRTVAFASGFKAARPDMKVMAVTGDGDGAGIGGNHLIHAARRNIDITVILMNNEIFGMTGGQFSPLTPNGARASTASYGSIEYPFDTCKLVEAAGATYIGRSTAYHYKLTEKLVMNALEHKGFSYIEVITQCPTTFGKRNKNRGADGYDMLMWQKQHGVMVDKAREMTEAELADKFIIGELFVNNNKVEYTDACKQLIDDAAKAKKGVEKCVQK